MEVEEESGSTAQDGVDFAGDSGSWQAIFKQEFMWVSQYITVLKYTIERYSYLWHDRISGNFANFPTSIANIFVAYSSYELETCYDYPVIILLEFQAPPISCVGVVSVHTTCGQKFAVLFLWFDGHQFWQEAIYSFKHRICEAGGLLCP